MLKKIISGGQTGADQAALDVAIKFGIPHGGWIPKGRKTEQGVLPDRYLLQETASEDYRDRTKKNIEISNGTAIISRGDLSGGSKLTLTHAKLVGRPYIYLDLAKTEDFEASIFLKTFIRENQIVVLNVAGPRLSHAPWIYEDVKMLMEACLYLLYLDHGWDKQLKPYIPDSEPVGDPPETIDQAVSMLISNLSLKSRTFIARQPATRILPIYFTLLDYIRAGVGFDAGNKSLLNACKKRVSLINFSVEDAVMVILKDLKKTLEKDHILRIVK